MKIAPLFTAPEILESRIAPAAVYYVSGHELKIATLSGLRAVEQLGDQSAAEAVDASAAILLSAGDSIVFDPDGNPATHQTDYKWVNVVAGKALVFFNDIDASGSYSLDELTGLAVGDKFSGTVNGDVNGSVATMLDVGNHFTPGTLQPASIARLTVTGAIATSGDAYYQQTGNLLAGAGMSNLSVGESYFGHQTGQSVEGLVATGDSAQRQALSFNGGYYRLVDVDFTAVAGAPGGDISNAHFTGGVGGLATGNGQNNAAGAGGAGGSMVNVTMGAANELFTGLRTGHGGNATMKSAAGGAGGKISGFAGTFAISPTLYTGDGGEGIEANGGAGGSIADSAFRVLGGIPNFDSWTGSGGDASGRGTGGAGGSIVNSSFQFLGALGSYTYDDANTKIFSTRSGFYLTLGNGGYAYGSGTGGAGGTFDWFFTKKNPLQLNSVSGGTNAAFTLNELSVFDLQTGAGGGSSNGAGGAGGAILGGIFNFKKGLGEFIGTPSSGNTGRSEGLFALQSGAGGEGMVKGGDAGRIQGGVFNFLESVHLSDFHRATAFLIQGGRGGDLIDTAGGRGGAGDGGDLEQLIVNLQGGLSRDGSYAKPFVISGGDGGKGETNIGGGGDGGEINGLAVLSQRAVAPLTVVAGNAGNAGTASAGQGTGGAGGNLVNFVIQAPSVDGALSLQSGSGGHGAGTGAGGQAGDIIAGAARTVFTPAPLTDAALAAQLHTAGGVYIAGSLGGLDVVSGDGGSGGSGTATANGGNAGSILNTRIATGDIADYLYVTGGSGGDGRGSGSGGLSGRSDGLNIQVHGDIGGGTDGSGDLELYFNSGGHGEAAGKDGATRNIDNLTILVAGKVYDHLHLTAPQGADGGVSTAGNAGGSFNNLHLDVGAIGSGNYPADFVLAVEAGNGAAGKVGGLGGSINGSTISVGVIGGSATISAGDAGASRSAAGSLGGSITKSTFLFHDLVGPADNSFSTLQVEAGDGGEGGSAKADGTGGFAGGGGGAVASTSVLTSAITGTLMVAAGSAGASHGGTGGTGGQVSGVTVENTGFVPNVFLQAGNGSNVDQGLASKGGSGGAITGTTYINQGGYDTLSVTAGDGGNHDGVAGTTSGDGGAGGALTGFVFENSDSYVPLFSRFVSGAGGDVTTSGASAVGNGGASGAVTGFVLHQMGDQVVSLEASRGGVAQGGKKGGDGGSVTGTVLDTYGAVEIYSGFGGDVDALTSKSTSSGGAGGLVSNVTGHAGSLSIYGGSGGAASGGKGGAGGSIDTVTLSSITSQVGTLEGGNGGTGATGGSGGSVSKITVPGNIGYFDGDIYGGLIAGQGGAGSGGTAGVNGSIANVTADRISAIYAAATAGGLFDPTGAVTSIKSVVANIIGADAPSSASTVNETSARGFGTFSYYDADGSNTFSTADGIIDGFVYVKASGYTATSLSTAPLKLITI